MAQPQLKLSEALPGDLAGHTDVTDDALVERIRQGDTHAADALVIRYHNHLRRFLARAVTSQNDLDDILQQTWLSVLEHLHQYRSGEAGTIGFKAWLFRIATNKSHDLWRARARSKRALDTMKLVHDETDAPADALPVQSEEARKLRDAVSRLPEPQRQVVLMRYDAGLKFTEIAEALGCPLNTALGRMHKALAKLRKFMEE